MLPSAAVPMLLSAQACGTLPVPVLSLALGPSSPSCSVKWAAPPQLALPPLSEPAALPPTARQVPEAKGSPGFIALYDYSAISASGDAPAPLCRKSFYRVGGQ